MEDWFKLDASLISSFSAHNYIADKIVGGPYYNLSSAYVWSLWSFNSWMFIFLNVTENVLLWITHS